MKIYEKSEEISTNKVKNSKSEYKQGLKSENKNPFIS
mgnify:CR=1 FL=1